MSFLNFSENENPYIIAEVGSNWHTLADCLKSIQVAKACGANAVKFQLFTCSDMYGKDYPKWKGKKWELLAEWIPALAKKCQEDGVDFLCTVFNPAKVAIVDPFVRFHKIASSDSEYTPLLQAVAKTGKPVILSTGASNLPTLKGPLSDLGEKVVLMYCVSSYPALYVNLYRINALKNAYPKCEVGFSDHTLDPYYYPKAAVRNHGAVVIEKHFSIFEGEGWDDNSTPDQKHSLKPYTIKMPDGSKIEAHQFKEMVQYVRGPGFITPYEDMRPDEVDMRMYHRRRQTTAGFYRVPTADMI